MPSLKAIIFDFDGVLANTIPLHFRMFRRVLSEQGITLTLATYDGQYIGLTDESCFRAAAKAEGRLFTDQELNQLMFQKRQLMQQALAEEPVLIPGIEAFVRAVAEQYRIAIASSTVRKEIELVLERAALDDLFEQISSAEDVAQGKPQPDLYLHAVAQMNVSEPLLSSECLAIEHTDHGISAAQQAGIRCLAVASSLDPVRLGRADAMVARLEYGDLSPLSRRFWTAPALQPPQLMEVMEDRA